ncbi:RNA polymerase subunit sigma-24 [Pseudoclavibacter endophyticus]|uniref:RNA polymerase sigma factor n=1 Tax=Pseudoclavibacter endophyticus TaxID=1778590 RepID=UPI00166AD546|nr:DUF6596 domain-containing protein [Pseudoclavibacter endophyticus]GGA58475.1 RNA polymerase subunit sigma-24 [Pseudoclavibacter endophyticus]
MTSESRTGSAAAPSSAHAAEAALARAMREDWGRILAHLIRASGRADLAEDALAQAFSEATAQWRRALPERPSAWLATVARRRLLDAIRADRTRLRKAHLVAAPATMPGPGPAETALLSEASPPGSERDERVALLFLATHPALDVDVRAALALRFVLGVETWRIARLFLVPTTTMAARLTRAKRRIVRAGIPLAAPARAMWRERVDDVARSILLAFTAGYAPGDESTVRADVAGDAVRLALVAHEALPEEPALQALAALVTIQHSRRDARTGPEGEPIVLADQDRTRWHRDEIALGLRLLEGLPSESGAAAWPGTAASRRDESAYAEELGLQAVIAAVHARARRAGDTDWRAIAVAYARLESLTGSPVVRLNRAVALAEVHGPMAGLAVLRAAGDALPGHHRVELVRAELLRRDGRVDDARVAYRLAIEACPPGAERRHLEGRLHQLGEEPGAFRGGPRAGCSGGEG